MSSGLAGLTPAESRWIDYVRSDVVPRLSGSAAERAQTAAIVTWWALKEGVLDVRPNPWRQNLCGQGGDHQIGDLEVCPSGHAWQVGMAGIQPIAATLARVEQVAQQIYPGENLSDVLRQIADDAGVDSSTANAIASSSGTLRKAWLLRDPAIAFTIQRPFVEAQCIRGNVSWCFGAWDTARRFASSNARIREVVGQLEDYFQTAPSRSGSGITSRVSSKTWLVLGLLALGAGGYYLYGTPKGKRLRRRFESKALSW